MWGNYSHVKKLTPDEKHKEFKDRSTNPKGTDIKKIKGPSDNPKETGSKKFENESDKSKGTDLENTKSNYRT
ncbi:hypothetical protein scyTo_0005819 [Scyliorhinus torazame]|uniref:Uncharacterized protein n=1 Tax=Scyliorhinus torazame TaxID=75743 RepID=A0A401PD36_SCYTO|nr:hypothetical protein [Scyliorhinus torazame]